MTTDSKRHFDSILFDMDGTLWDAVDSYCAVWNDAIDRCCPEVPHVEYSELAAMMGKPLEVIYARFIGDRYPLDKFMTELLASEKVLMPKLGGALYPHVAATIEKLSKKHRLFMVSNCTPEGLPNFLAFTGLKPYFTDSVSYGQTGHEKDVNIAMLVDKYSLESPLYVGDTEGDCVSSHKAGVPFAWATYGFGRGVENQDYTLNSIADLLEICD